MNIEDLIIAARTVFGEARNQPYEGQRAVACVILNRAKIEGSIAGACLRPKQFSCWNPGDATRERMVNADFDDKNLRLALRAVLDAISGPDITGGARHYHTRGVSPAWSRGREPDLVIGDHLFFCGIP
jgi:N-acetylmuramoyl-L-alanine amidase